MNPIFNAMGAVPMFGNMQNFMSQFSQFRQMMNGDPEQIISAMLQRGQIDQSQLEQAKQMAEQIQQMMK